MTDIILTRSLLKTADGRSFPVGVSISRPVCLCEGEWSCRLQIISDSSFSHDVSGVDSWQAVELAMKLASNELSLIASHAELRRENSNDIFDVD